MHRAIGVEAADETKIVDAARNVRKKSRDLASALTIPLELPGASEKRRIALGELADHGPVTGRQRLSIVFLERGFWIEGIDLARTANHEEENDGFGFSGIVLRLGGERVDPIGRISAGRQLRGERQRSESVGGAHQHVAERYRWTRVT